MKLKVTQVRASSGKTATLRATLIGLGLGRPHKVAIVDNTPSFRGAIKKVMHLVKVETVSEEKA